MTVEDRIVQRVLRTVEGGEAVPAGDPVECVQQLGEVGEPGPLGQVGSGVRKVGPHGGGEVEQRAEDAGMCLFVGGPQRARRALAGMKPFRKVTGAATRQRIRATLRAALNDAIAQQLITFNPASHVELETGKRPKALVWTEDRITQWKRTGEKPSPVMVWTPEQTGQFLDRAAKHRLYALYHLITFRGLRRGEGCGQQWADTDLSAGLLTVATQLVQRGWKVEESAPKTDSGERVVALDSETVKVLKAHRKRQMTERLQWGEAYVETGGSSHRRTASGSTRHG
ncbi:site-specific integrase [Streptomyces sp. CA-294286]|uniref:site-specific integrase n=1 Tax=Streptomyces sp. CA-294286 TaxID=3240070 RepID=UPI003D8F8B5D